MIITELDDRLAAISLKEKTYILVINKEANKEVYETITCVFHNVCVTLVEYTEELELPKPKDSIVLFVSDFEYYDAINAFGETAFARFCDNGYTFENFVFINLGTEISEEKCLHASSRDWIHNDQHLYFSYIMTKPEKPTPLAEEINTDQLEEIEEEVSENQTLEVVSEEELAKIDAQLFFFEEMEKYEVISCIKDASYVSNSFLTGSLRSIEYSIGDRYYNYQPTRVCPTRLEEFILSILENKISLWIEE